MKKQIWFETDLSFVETKVKLLRSRELLVGGALDNRGRFSFHLKSLKDFTIQITTKGKLSITYPEESNYDLVLRQLKPFLITAEGSPAKIISEIYHSKKEVVVQDSIKKAKNQSSLSALGKTNVKENRKLRRLMAERDAEIEISSLDETEWTQEKDWKIRKKWRKRYNVE